MKGSHRRNQYTGQLSPPGTGIISQVFLKAAPDRQTDLRQALVLQPYVVICWPSVLVCQNLGYMRDALHLGLMQVGARPRPQVYCFMGKFQVVSTNDKVSIELQSCVLTL